MKKCAFIGGYDKTEILLFLAKIATLIGRKVLIIDATIPQKARYIVPVMTPTQKYITNFENIDIEDLTLTGMIDDFVVLFPLMQISDIHILALTVPVKDSSIATMMTRDLTAKFFISQM